ncbi:MAG TPA: GSCFA domain-containing protein [Flavitalea sp.]|nr:GSCFA domain-containing protein [Flavitalea sp.]
MDFMLDLPVVPPEPRIKYGDKLLLTGSCFTEHIGNSLSGLKFDVLQNPNGILFDPASVAYSLVSYVQNQQYEPDDLFELNEVWNSWQHHSIFSHINQKDCLKKINESQARAHDFLKQADWLLITLGSSFSYHLSEKSNSLRDGVANCHRAPAQWFNKHLMTIEEINIALDNCIHQLFMFNPSLKIIFTVSPVRHIRDGVVENNRSKARLIEVVHHLANKFDRIYYFPAYELVIDVLRDYRFYDLDMVHPNYQATQFVLEKFMQHFVNDESQKLAEEIQKIVIARKHKPFQPDTEAHKKFLQVNFDKASAIQKKYPYLSFQEEIDYFSLGVRDGNNYS